MNFAGKYWTRNRTLVLVEPVTQIVDGQEWVKWRGEKVEEPKRKQQPFEYTPNATFYWDEKGLCVLTFGADVGPVGDWDLMERLNPQSEGI